MSKMPPRASGTRITTENQKTRHPFDWLRQDAIPWTVVVDTLEGSTHKTYGRVPSSAYLLSVTGRVLFRSLWPQREQMLGRIILKLLASGGMMAYAPAGTSAVAPSFKYGVLSRIFILHFCAEATKLSMTSGRLWAASCLLVPRPLAQKGVSTPVHS